MAGSNTEKAVGSPNIVYIMADDMGFGDVGCYNPNSDIPTPNMDRLAAEGVRMTDVHAAAAVCTPSRYGIMTGRYCWRTDLTEEVLYNYEPPLIDRDRMTIASLLSRHGYRTGCIGKWHLGLDWSVHEGEEFELFGEDLPWPSPPPSAEEEAKIDFTQPITGGPNEFGFDYFFGTSGCSTAQPPYAFIENERMVELPTVRETDSIPGSRDGAKAPGWRHQDVDPVFTDRALRFMERHARDDDGSPFFLYLAASAPHAPCDYGVVPDFARRRTSAGSRGDLVYLFDWMVGQVLDKLEELGVAEDTLVIVTSDNGALPLHSTTPEEQEALAQCEHESCGDWRGFKGQIWEGGHRVPFIARWPGVIEPGTTSDRLAGLQDVFATAADLVGFDLPRDAGEDSVSILPAIVDETPVRDDLIHHSSLGVFSVRKENWKLVIDCDNSGDIGRGAGNEGTRPDPDLLGQLYDISEDPYETTNLFDDRPEKVEEIRSMVDEYRRNGRSVPAGR